MRISRLELGQKGRVRPERILVVLVVSTFIECTFFSIHMAVLK